jgi:hypothetical protein
VSADIIGMPRAAAIIEGHETHTRTAEAFVDLAKVPGVDARVDRRIRKHGLAHSRDAGGHLRLVRQRKRKLRSHAGGSDGFDCRQPGMKPGAAPGLMP